MFCILSYPPADSDDGVGTVLQHCEGIHSADAGAKHSSGPLLDDMNRQAPKDIYEVFLPDYSHNDRNLPAVNNRALDGSSQKPRS